tara:strand:+ start:706 stop:1029 length:324 start_codon:yes stop_codon:yes gene_type:complete
MALVITAEGDARLIISGTATDLATIYSRIEFACPKNGASMQGALYNYGAKAEYDASPSSLLRIDDLITTYNVEIDIATEEQSLQVGHEKIKAQLEAVGYTVAIVDLP